MKKTSCMQVFRLVFVLFFIYLLGDAFYRWDGFRYYATFSEFVPSVALITILWGILALFTSLLIWLSLKICEWFCLHRGWKFKMEHGLIYTVEFVLLGAVIWIAKRYMFPQVTSQYLRLIVCLGLTFTAFFLTWLFRDKAEQWMEHIQERITPLFWLFVMLTVLSMPVTAYHAWVKKTGDAILLETTQSSTARKNRPNIILVTFDALRARDMSVYGYYRETTPFIGTWARSASIFSRLEASSTYTTPTTASLMTGKRVWTHWTFHNEGSKPDRSYNESLPSLLRKNGYYTTAFIGAEPATVTQLGIDHDFDFAPYASDFITPHSLLGNINKLLYKLFSDKFRLYDWIVKKDFVFYQFLTHLSRKVMRTERLTYDVFERFFLNVDDHRETPFFTWIHLHPPHDPYLPPQPFMGMFDASPELRTKESQGKLLDGTGKVTITEEMQDVINTLRARYDENIRHCDNEFENFIKKLSSRNLLNNTIIILSSDHGESFEHNVLGHGCLDLFEEVTNIPLIIKMPGDSDGKVINNVTEQIDIPATILDFANIPVPAWMEGRSLRPLTYGEDIVPKPAFSMALFSNEVGKQIFKGTFAVWEGDYKLIYYLTENKSLLFNLKYDPDEMHNLFDTDPLIGGRMLGMLKENLEEANEKIGGIKKLSQEGS